MLSSCTYFLVLNWILSKSSISWILFQVFSPGYLKYRRHTVYKNRLLFHLLQTQNNWKPCWIISLYRFGWDLISSQDCLYSWWQSISCPPPLSHGWCEERTPPPFPLYIAGGFEGQIWLYVLSSNRMFFHTYLLLPHGSKPCCGSHPIIIICNNLTPSSPPEKE
jgi:hypothetical protein